MNMFFRLLVLGVCLALCGCGKPTKPMPLTKENVAAYMQKMETAVKSITPKEYEEAKGNTARQKELYYRTFVEPMEKMGYSYDKTIGVISSQVLSKTLRTTDTAMTVMVSDLLAFAKNSRMTSFNYGFISKETKDLLDQVSLIFPR